MSRISKYKTPEERRAAKLQSQKKYRDSHKHIAQAYRERNKEKLKKYLHDRYLKIKNSLDKVRLRETARKRREANPEKYRAKDKISYLGRKERITLYKNHNKIRIFARTLINNSIRDGKLKRENCVVCAKLYQINKIGEAHHVDYTKPLDVMWLCKLHHAAWHRVFEPEYGPTTST